MLTQKQNRIRDKKHRKWISTLPCCVSGIHGMTQAAHVSKGRYSMGMKASDDCVVPLSVFEHRRQHETSEEIYWNRHGGIDKAKDLAKTLYAITGDTDEALILIARFMR